MHAFWQKSEGELSEWSKEPHSKCGIRITSYRGFESLTLRKMSERSHDIIDLSRLPIGTHSFDIQLDNDFFSSLEKSEILNGKVTAKVTLNLREEDYSLRIAVQGTVFVVCDRCLDPMSIEIDANDEFDNSDASLNGEGLQITGYGLQDSKLDLTWLAYEIVSINIPLVHSHQAGECNKQMELLLHNHLCDEPNPEG